MGPHPARATLAVQDGVSRAGGRRGSPARRGTGQNGEAADGGPEVLDVAGTHQRLSAESVQLGSP